LRDYWSKSIIQERILAKLGLSGLIGLVLGILAVAVIRPLTSAGTVLIIVLSIAIGIAVGSIIRSRRHTGRGSKK
jgi:uncharacterized membrane protein YfcA